MALPHDPGVYEALATSMSFLGAAVVYGLSLLDRRREQARKVSAWFDLATEEGLPSHEQELELHVLNSSDQPVHQCIVQARGVDAESYHFAVLPPGKTQADASRSLLSEHDWWPPIAVDLRFRDAAGRRWHRSGPGHKLRRCRRWHDH